MPWCSPRAPMSVACRAMPKGHFSVQDGAAQQVADVLDLNDGQRVLDACAAPGGKAAHMLERADVELTCARSRCGALAANAAEPRCVSASKRERRRRRCERGPTAWWDGRPFDRILLDAPCSATGIIRRQPDIKLHRRAGDIAAARRDPGKTAHALWPMLAPGGRLAVCNLLAAARRKRGGAGGVAGCATDARAVPLPEHSAASPVPGGRICRAAGGMDGFYYALVEKTA